MAGGRGGGRRIEPVFDGASGARASHDLRASRADRAGESMGGSRGLAADQAAAGGRSAAVAERVAAGGGGARSSGGSPTPG